MTRTTLLTMSLTLLLGPSASAQIPLILPPDPIPVIPPDNFTWSERPTRPTQRIRLLRFQPGFLSDPVNLFPDTASPTVPVPAYQTFDDGSFDWMTFTMGNDNPFTDFRRGNGQGGVGYYRMCGQFQLVDSGSTGFSLNLQAVTPAGREMDGVENGTTVFTPALAIYHELTTGFAFHGFVGSHLNLNGFPLTGVGTGIGPGPQMPNYQVEYGVALQHPLLLPEKDEEAGLYLYLGALGRVNDLRDPGYGRQATGMEMLPGLHWQVDRKTWLSGAFVVPVHRTSRQDPPLWQLTAQFQF